MSTLGWVILTLMLLATVLLFVLVSAFSKRNNSKTEKHPSPPKQTHWINMLSNIKNYRKQEFWINKSETYRQLNQKVNELSDSESEKESS